MCNNALLCGQCGGNQRLMECYSAKLVELQTSGNLPKIDLAKRYIAVARLL